MARKRRNNILESFAQKVVGGEGKEVGEGFLYNFSKAAKFFEVSVHKKLKYTHPHYICFLHL
jgi:hypothetical protein